MHYCYLLTAKASAEVRVITVGDLRPKRIGLYVKRQDEWLFTDNRNMHSYKVFIIQNIHIVLCFLDYNTVNFITVRFYKFLE